MMSFQEIFVRIKAAISDLKPADLDKAISDAISERLDPEKIMESMGEAAVELKEICQWRSGPARGAFDGKDV